MKTILSICGVLALASFLHAAERIVTLGGSVTETVFALGAGDLVVARDMSSVYPPAATKLPDVGYFRTIGAEGVLAQKPTLILAAYGIGPESQVELLRKSGVRFVLVEAKPSAESTAAMVKEIGALVDREQAADALIEHLHARLSEAQKLARASAKPPRVVVLMGAGAGVLQAAYDGTAASALLSLAGAQNPFTGYKGYKTTNAEELFVADPDFIFIASHDGDEVGEKFGQPKNPPEWLLNTRAARNGRLLTFDMAYYLVFGPRIGDAVVTFAQTLHTPIPAASSH